MDSNDVGAQVGAGYPVGQLAKAFVTAATHEDAGTRERAQERARRWSAVLAGMAFGGLTVGSRTPVKGMPVWVTPEMVRGGFATGAPAAGGPLRAHEVELTALGGVAAERGALFAWFLGEAGLAELRSMLDGGGYRVEVPEHAALLTVAWLLRAGDRARALGLLDEIGPYAAQLCFAPVPDPQGARDASVVWREPAGEVGRALAGRGENPRVKAMREALTVWNPLADELLDLWLDTRDGDGRVGGVFPPGWRQRAEELMARYGRLAAVHTYCSKHRRPKENLAILRTAAQETLAGRPLTPRALGCCGTRWSRCWAAAEAPARRSMPRCVPPRRGSRRYPAITNWPGWWWPGSPRMTGTPGSPMSMRSACRLPRRRRPRTPCRRARSCRSRSSGWCVGPPPAPSRT